jgi:serine/threonine-protein kinase
MTDDSTLSAILAAYLQAVDAGEGPDREALIARHPQRADDLRAFFTTQDEVAQLARPLRAAARDIPGPEPAAGGTTAPAGAVRYVGDYEIQEELGRGGMGVVYRARQVRLNRPVALKMILAGRLAAAADVQRFRAEAEAVANLDHPHIVPIYEVGEYEGQHYFSMKLIDGSSLAARAPQLARAPRQAAALLARVARAVHYAHQRGILHRDLKPANVLLDREGQPYVTDFGLAKRLGGDRALTCSGAIVGTPGYMAPEQASGPRHAVTTAADVYSLGAILYELLTGRPPFRADTPLATLLRVLDREPERPRSLCPRVDRDLETVCLKCLAKEPPRRYASALELADDLERYLQGRPVAARPAGPAGQAWRWCRRNRAAAGLLALAALSLLAGTGLASWFAVRADDRAREERVQRDKARARLRLARQAVDRFFTQVGESPEMRAEGVEPVRTKLLEAASEFYGQLVREDGDDPGVRDECGLAFDRLGTLYKLTGHYDKAEGAYREALGILRPLAEAHPGEPRYQEHLAHSQLGLGIVFQTTGRSGEAERAFREARALFGSLTAARPDEPRYQTWLASSLNNLGRVLAATGRPAAAEQSHRESLALRRRLVEAHPENQDYRADLVRSHLNLGGLYLATRRSRPAAQAYREAASVGQDLVKAYPKEPECLELLAHARSNLGAAYRGAGQHGPAQEASREGRALWRALADRHPGVPRYREGLANNALTLGRSYRATGRAGEAEKACREAQAVCRRLLADGPAGPRYRRLLAAAHLELGHVYRQGGRLGPAEVEYRAALAAAEQLTAAHPEAPACAADLARACCNLGHVAALGGKPWAALGWYGEAVRALLRAPGKGPGAG